MSSNKKPEIGDIKVVKIKIEEDSPKSKIKKISYQTVDEVPLVSFGLGADEDNIDNLWIKFGKFLDEHKIKEIYNLKIEKVVKLVFSCKETDVKQLKNKK